MDKGSLESVTEKEHTGYVRRVFSKEWVTLPNVIISSVIAYGCAVHGTEYLQNVDINEHLKTALITSSDVVPYTLSLYAQFLFRDRKRMKNEDGSWSWQHVKERLVDNFALTASIEASYILWRTAGQHFFQEQGYDPVRVTEIFQPSLSFSFIVGVPFFKYHWDTISGKAREGFHYARSVMANGLRNV